MQPEQKKRRCTGQFKYISSISAIISLISATSQIELLSRMAHNSLRMLHRKGCG